MFLLCCVYLLLISQQYTYFIYLELIVYQNAETNLCVMNEFEKEYYENENFWKSEAFGDFDKNRIVETVSFIPREVNQLLDVGCGNGVFCNYLAIERNNIEITGLDRSETALKYLKTAKILGDITHIPFSDGKFQCVTCLEVLEHLTIEDYAKAIDELARVSSRYIILSVPYNENLEKNLTQCPKCKTAFNLDLHLRSFNKNDLEALLLHQDFECITLKTFGNRKKLIGSQLFRKIVKLNINRGFNSPICPICGFKNEEFHIEREGNVVPKTKSFISFIMNAINLFWPKINADDYWIIALYRKGNIHIS